MPDWRFGESGKKGLDEEINRSEPTSLDKLFVAIPIPILGERSAFRYFYNRAIKKGDEHWHSHHDETYTAIDDALIGTLISRFASYGLSFSIIYPLLK